MSLSLPQEIFNLIVDHLHDDPTTLRACCLVSKSWIPRTRIHLFNRVEFRSYGPTLESWMQAFPNPSNSPAHYTRSLHLLYSAVLNALPWIRSFNHIVELVVGSLESDSGRTSFAQLCGLSPTLKRLNIFYSRAPLSDFLDFICSFPFLEDLSLHYLTTEGNTNEWAAPPTSPKFTRSFSLSCSSGNITRKLLYLPGGLHFSKITLGCLIGGDLAEELVSTCSDTLQSVCVDFYWDARPRETLPSLNLSNANNLKDVEFRLRGQNVKWISATLRTAKSKNLRQITILFYSLLHNPVGELTREWEDLDHLLVQLWNTRSVRPVLAYDMVGKRTMPEVLVRKLLPELLSRGVVDVD